MPKLKKRIDFLAEYLKNFKLVGSITPSSKFLVSKISNKIDFQNAEVIVELGPGDGCITRMLINKKKSSSKLLLVEKNEIFFRKLKNMSEEDVELFRGNAINLDKFLAGQKADCIVSSLPFSSMKKPVRIKMLEKISSSLNQDGQLVLYQYTTLIREFLEENFSEIKTSFEPRNVPPAFVFSCRK